MTVKELKRLLLNFDDNKEIFIDMDYNLSDNFSPYESKVLLGDEAPIKVDDDYVLQDGEEGEIIDAYIINME